MSTVPAPHPAIPTVQVQGDVQGSIVFGDHNFVVNSNHGTIVYHASKAGISRIAHRPKPPRPPINFLDRESELQQASSLLINNNPAVLHGITGIGKTSLLKQIANAQPAERFPDGVVFIDGEWEALDRSGLDGVVQSVFDALFESDPPQKVSLATARTYLGSLQPLILLDHLTLPSDAWQKLPDLFPSGGIIWSMTGPHPGHVAVELLVPGLPPAEAHKLLLQASGTDESQSDPGLVQMICDRLDYHPLSIITVGKWIGARNIPIPEALKLIFSQESDEQDTGAHYFPTILSSLDEPEEKLLSALASIAGPVIDRSTLIRASGIDHSLADKALNRLMDLGLVHAFSPEVGMHPAHKSITRRLLPADDGQSSRLGEAILNEFIAHQSTPDDRRSQLGNLLGAMDYFIQSGRIDRAGMAARLAVPLLVLSGKWDLWRETFLRISNTSQVHADNSLLGRALHELGTHRLAVDEHAEAINLLTQARDIRLQNGDQIGAAYSQHNLNFIIGPPPPGKPPGPETASPSSPFPTRFFLGGLALISLFGLGLFLVLSYLFWSPSPSNPDPVPTTAVGMGIPTDTINSLPAITITPTPSPSPTGTIVHTTSPSPTPSFTPTFTISPSPTHTSTHTPTWTPTWTPTNTTPPTITPYPEPFGFIVFQSNRNGNREIFRMRADGSNQTRLTNIDGSDNRPSISPNGDRIAFIHGDGNNRNIYYTSGSSTKYGPSMFNVNENNPDWSPDGRYLVYQSNKDGDMDIYIFDVNDPKGEQFPITTNQNSDICPAWFPDPNDPRIAYTSDIRDNNFEIYIKNRDGTNRQRLTRNPALDRCPVWSPDGKLIAFLSDRNDPGGDEQIWIMNADGTNPWQPRNMVPVLTPASWSPDGKWLAFTANISGNSEIYIISLTGEFRNISRHPDTDSYPEWTERMNLNPIYTEPGPVVD